MKYYQIRNSVDIDETGVSGQVQTHIGNYDFRESNSIRRIPLYGSIDYHLKLPIFKLEDDANPTDLLDNIYSKGRTLLISPKAWNVFQKFSIVDFQVYPAKVQHINSVLNYYLLFLPIEKENKFLDWASSIFSIFQRSNNSSEHQIIGNIDFNTYENFRLLGDFFNVGNKFVKKEKFEYATIKIEALLFLKEKKIEIKPTVSLDLFRMFTMSSGIFVSEKLRSAIEKNQLTGFRFIPLSGNES